MTFSTALPSPQADHPPMSSPRLLRLLVVAVLALAARHPVMPRELEALAALPAQAGMWVFLDPDRAASDLPPAISAAARAARPLLETDRPPDPELVRRIAATGAHVRYVSRWLRAVSVDADSATLRRIMAIPGVTGMTPIRDLQPAAGPAAAERLSAEAARGGATVPGAAAASSSQDSAFYGATYAALRELNIPILHQLGFTGAASRIAILDTGFYLDHETLVTRRVDAYRDFLGGAGAEGQEAHGTAVFSLLGGHAPGRLVGGAYRASFYLAKVDIAGVDTQGDEDRWVAAVEWADSVGARLINSSIGFRDDFTDRPPIPYGDLDGNTTVTTRMADEAARRGILLVQAIGNDGPAPGSLWAPADADSILVVGAADSLLLPARIAVSNEVSSRGPTADGRVKPDVVARGHALRAAATASPTSYVGGLTGSSYATPFISAGAALFAEAWPALSAMAVREALREAGSNARMRDNVVGWGMPDIAAAVMFPQGLLLTQNSLTPTDLQGNVTTITPTFRWTAPLVHPLMQPVTYRIQIASDSLFQNIVFSDSVTDANSYVARRALRPLARAWWRVVATSPQGVRRTTAPRPAFTIPSWVRLLTLAGPEPAFVTELRPELSWAPLSAPAPVGPFTYQVQVLSPEGDVLQDTTNLSTSSIRIPRALTPNQSYRWRVIARTQTGMADTVETATPFVVVSDQAPPATLLYQNFPNPFPRGFGDQTTRIWFDLAEDADVELTVHDLRGRLVRRLIPAAPGCGTVRLPAGLYGRPGGSTGSAAPACVLFAWDARDERDRRVPRGVYVLRLRAAGVTDIRRILYLPQ
jgi:serine protease AprX